MPRSVVVDTSTLVSAFLFPKSLPGRVIDLANEGAYTLYFSPILLEELKRSLNNPRLRNAYGYTDEDIQAWCTNLYKMGCHILQSLPDIPSVCRDPDDDHVIAAALVAGAGWIVTGDKDLLDLGQYKDIRIVNAREFLER